MDSTRFDDLTKALATSTSRRQAIRRIGGTLAGSLLAAWPFTQAIAAGGGNSQCAHWCATVFGADTPAAAQCTSEAAHGKGLCHQCGSATPSSICCTRNSSGYCSSYSGAHCPCPSGQTCQSGTCVTCNANGNTCNVGTDCCSGTCCQGTCCSSGQVCLSNGTCANTCGVNGDPSPCPCDECQPNRNLCTTGTLNFTGCSSDSDCPKGQFCDGGFCVVGC